MAVFGVKNTLLKEEFQQIAIGSRSLGEGGKEKLGFWRR